MSAVPSPSQSSALRHAIEAQAAQVAAVVFPPRLRSEPEMLFGVPPQKDDWPT
jgi:hypothetical protein